MTRRQTKHSGGVDNHGPGDQVRPMSRARPSYLPPKDDNPVLHPHEPVPPTVGLSRPKMDKPRPRQSNSGSSLVNEAHHALGHPPTRHGSQRAPSDAGLHLPHIEGKGTGQRSAKKQLPRIEEAMVHCKTVDKPGDKPPHAPRSMHDRMDHSLQHEPADSRSFQLPSLKGKVPAPPEAPKPCIPRTKTFAHSHHPAGHPSSGPSHSHHATPSHSHYATGPASHHVTNPASHHGPAQSHSNHATSTAAHHAAGMTQHHAANPSAHHVANPAAQHGLAQSHSNHATSQVAHHVANPAAHHVANPATHHVANPAAHHVANSATQHATSGRRFKTKPAQQVVVTEFQPAPPPPRPPDYVPAATAAKPSRMMSPEAKVSDHMISSTKEKILLSPNDLRVISPASTDGRLGCLQTGAHYGIIKSPSSLEPAPSSTAVVYDKIRRSPPSLIDVNIQPSQHSLASSSSIHTVPSTNSYTAPRPPSNAPRPPSNAPRPSSSAHTQPSSSYSSCHTPAEKRCKRRRAGPT